MPAKIRGPHLIIHKENLTGRIYELTKRITVVGRDPSCDVVVGEVAVSREHVRFILVDDQQPRYELEDMNSTNGTFVNGEKVSGRIPVSFDDEIVLATDVVVMLRHGIFQKPPTPVEVTVMDTQQVPRVVGMTRRIDAEKYAGLTLEELSPSDDYDYTDQNKPVVGLLKRIVSDEETIPDRPHVFISYSRKDTEVMEKVYRTLQDANLSVWVDQKLEPGERSWRRAVEKAIDNASCIVLILTPDAKGSEWVEAELDYAQTQNKKIFCVFARGDRGSAALLGYTLTQWVNIQKEYDKPMQDLIAAIRKYLQFTEKK